MAREFRLPDLGEGITEAQIIQVLIKEGDTINEDDGLFEVETDKAAVEIPSPFSGTVTKVHVAVAQTINVGDVMVTLDGDDPPSATTATTKDKAATPVAAASPAASVASAISRRTTAGTSAPAAKKTTAAAAPTVRRLARELAVDIDSINGTGPGGRVLKADVEAAVIGSAPEAEIISQASQTGGPPQPANRSQTVADADKWGPVRREKMTQVRKTIALRMTRAVTIIPHVTHMDTVDVTDLEALRKQYKGGNGGKRRMTTMSFVIAAAARTLKNHPIFNAGVDMKAGEIIYKDYINIGIAVDTDRGLLVPNIRNTDKLTILQIAEALADLADRARNGRLGIEDLRGGTFTITNIGALGGVFGTPIINYPEVAILALGRASDTLKAKRGRIVTRSILPVSLSFDHRAADGGQVARFCKEFLGYLENPGTLLV